MSSNHQTPEQLTIDTLRRLKVSLPSIIRNTPHSCLTEEHCCALHAAHKAAAEKVVEHIQGIMDRIEADNS